MSTQADQLGERVIVTGRAYVWMVEAADVLLDHRPAWTERVLLRLVRPLLPKVARSGYIVAPRHHWRDSSGKRKDAGRGEGIY